MRGERQGGGGFRGRGGGRGAKAARGGRGGGGNAARGGRGGSASRRGSGGGLKRGRGGGASGGGRKAVLVVPHKFEGVFVAKGKAEALLTLNLNPGVSVYGEKRIEAEAPAAAAAATTETGETAAATAAAKAEYRVWNPFRSKLGAGIVGGLSGMPIVRGSRVLYLGAANGTTVSHVSDMVGAEGVVYAVEFSQRAALDLLSLCRSRKNVVPIIQDARQPAKYRMLVHSLVDVLFADVAQPDQARILALNARLFLKPHGHFIISIKASCIDSTASSPALVFANEVNALRALNLKPKEQLTLEPYHRDHALVLGIFKPA